MRRHPRAVGFLWRWHRRLGLFAALFVLLLAGTGIALNHSAGLGLDRRFVEWPWLNGIYGDHSADLPAYQLGEHWLSRTASGLVYLDTLEVAPCQGDLVGALRAGDVLYVACAGELLLVTGAGELVETVTTSSGLPAGVTGIGDADGDIALQAGGTWWLADLEQMDFAARAPAGSLVRQLSPGPLPQDIRRGIPAQAQWLSWERLLLDLHSGRVFGRPGVWLVDGVGVLLGGLALSGVGMWWLHRRPRQGGSRPPGEPVPPCRVRRDSASGLPTPRRN